MSLFLAAAAGFLSGKAKLAQEKREEERAAREEERLLDRQKRLYQFQYDIQRRSTLDEEASDLAKRVQALVRTAGIDEGTAINVVQFGAYDDVFNAAVQGKLNPVAVQAMFGNSDDTAPAAMPEPDTYTTDMGEPARRPAVETQGIFMPEEPAGRTASQTVTDMNSFDRSMTNTLSSILPQGTFEIRSTPEGTHIVGSNRATNVAKAGIVTEAFRAYTRLAADPEIGPVVALNRIQNFLLNQGQQISDFSNYDELVAKIYEPLRSLSFGDDVMPRFYVPNSARPTTPEDEETGPAGVVPSGGWNTGVNFN